MIYKALEIDELINQKDECIQMLDLLEENESKLKLIYLKKHNEIEPHSSPLNVCLYVIDGEIEITFWDDNCACGTCGCDLPNENDDETKKYKIKKGQLFLFEKEVIHSVKALKDTSFFAIRI